MFGKRCQSCNSAHAKRADFGIRQRLCKTCRNHKVVRLDWKSETLKDVHPMTKDCVLPALHSQNDVRYFARAPYGLIADVEYYSALLWELEYEDEAEEEIAALLALTAGSDFQTSSRMRNVKQISYVELDSDNAKRRKKGGEFVSRSERVRAFVAQRQRICEQFREDGKILAVVEDDLRKKLRETSRSRFFGENFDESLKRSMQVEARLEELGEEVGEEVYLDHDWFESKLVFQTKPLTDEEWDLIKDDVIKHLQRIRRKVAHESINKKRQDGQEALRPRYDKLKQTFNKKAQPFLPLFVDFLLFESVRPLWESSDVKVTDKRWKARLEMIKEELEQYRLDLVMHARQVILAATMDPDDPQTQAELDKPVEEADLSDAFFARATSFICCSFTNCARPIKLEQAVKMSPMPDETDSIGPLRAVLKHQHRSHNFVQTAKAIQAGPQLRIKLPLEIACAMSAILEISGLDEMTAGKRELKRFESASCPYVCEWDNTVCGHRRFWSWFRLLHKIKMETDKAARNKPPLALEPPRIVLRQWQYKQPFPFGRDDPSSSGSSSDDDTSGPSSASPSYSRKRKAIVFSDSDDSSDDDGRRTTVKAEPSDNHSIRLASDDDELSQRRARSRRIVSDSEEDEDDEDEVESG